MSVKEAIAAKLRAGFDPLTLEVIDESALHAGHREGGGTETHFRVRIVSAAFSGQTRLDRHRAINEVLASAFAQGVHALAIDARAPGE